MEIARRTWAEIRADDVFGRAAQLAYFFFLALFPFLICVVATLSVFGTADRGRALIFDLAARLLPPQAFELIVTTFNQILASSGPLKMSLSIVASVWSASLGMSALMNTLNAAYKVRETRSLVKQYAVAVGLTVGLSALTVAATLTVVLGDTLAHEMQLPPAASLAWHIVEWPLAVALLLFGFAVTYYFAPDVKQRRWHWISPGAVAGVLLLMLISVGLRIYLHFSGGYASTYGSLGGVIVLLLCFYLGGIALLSGGALNGVLEEVAANPASVHGQGGPGREEKRCA